MTTRRAFLITSGGLVSAARLRAAPLNPKERVDRTLKGAEVDRAPFSLWHHFGLKTAEEHAKRTLEFQSRYRTDIVKVMSDFPYPKGSGANWWELQPVTNPYPDQIKALELIRDGLGGRKYFVETIFNSWNVAEKLSSKAEVRRLKGENPDALLRALDAITTSQIDHAKRALSTGASGILLAVANANAKEMPKADYAKFSAPFDKKLLNSVVEAKLNILHLHVDRDYLDAVADLPAAVVNYSLHVTGIPMADMRKRFPGRVLMGGVDERAYESLSKEQIRQQLREARRTAGSRLIASPGCSVPDNSRTESLVRFAEALGA